MAFRSTNVGVDTANYAQLFTTISNIRLSEIFSSEIYADKLGYVILMKACSWFVDDYYFFQIMISLVYCIGMFSFFKRNSENLFLSCVVFLSSGMYLGAFNVTRQAVAVMLVLVAWNYLQDGKRYRAFVMIIAATTMHATAILFLCAMLVYWLRNNQKIIRVLLVLLVIAAFNYKAILNYSSQYFAIYENYFSNTKTIQNASAGLVIILWVIIAILALKIVFGNKALNSYERIYALFSIIYVVANVIGIYFNYFERLGMYFLPFVPLLFESTGEHIHNNSLKRIYTCGVVICFIAYFFLSANSSQYIYESFLFSE